MSEMRSLPQRLTRQLAAKGVSGAKQMALGLLHQRGQMADGKLTAAGRKREALGAAGRAKDRAAKQSGGSPGDYQYNAKTNRTRKKT